MAEIEPPLAEEKEPEPEVDEREDLCAREGELWYREEEGFCQPEAEKLVLLLRPSGVWLAAGGSMARGGQEAEWCAFA